MQCFLYWTNGKHISSHISNIKNFIPFSNNSSCVSNHFNKRDHNFYRDFKLTIFKDNIHDTNTRLRLESQLINLVKLIDPDIINHEFPLKKGSHVPLFSVCE